ncbi:MAG: hypothetical protein E7542_04200 [Ruminococcaceae bacterium]|nr:hypothetical protein [Oscillospiraceae bacterium]
MNMKKIIALILALALLVTLCGCGEDTSSESSNPQSEKDQTQYKNSMTLLYSAADSFNPYEASTDINRQLCKLLYEPLIKTDNNFKAHYSIAKSVKTVKNVCTVVIKDVKFSDNTTLTADDVVYSYKLAKKSATSYASKLYEVESVAAKDSKTVVFTLKKNDPYFVNVLDFPIIKAGSEKKKDSDSVKFPPVGAGRYKLNDENTTLLQNENYYGQKGSVVTINLINAPDNESISHYVEIGATDMYFSDISDGTIYRMSGTKTDINLNNLVYIGINHKNGKLALNQLRQALSSGINRQKICKDAFYNNALAATGFFNPLWEETKSVQNIQITSNSQITVENLKEIGYNVLDKDGKPKTKLKFSLLVNKENKARVSAANLISAQLKEYGISITVRKVSYKEYKSMLKKGHFDLYLGEVKITENMDLSELVSSGGSAAFGIKKPKSSKEDTEANEKDETEETQDTAESLDCAKIIKGFYKGKNSINDVAVTLQSDMPIIPVCYRMGVLFSDENIEKVNIASLSDIYFSIQSYKFKSE